MKYVIAQQTRPKRKCYTALRNNQDSLKSWELCNISCHFRCDNFYELPHHSGRSTSLGYGHKYDFTKK